ncbi:FxDxF family PEP-CTERM protein, partial [Roseateles sp. GG27B]
SDSGVTCRVPRTSTNRCPGSISGGTLAMAESLQLDSTASSQNLSFANTLGAGSYSLLISGISQRAKTAYTFNVDVTPVPEPETYALLLAGLGVLAFVAKRRKSV